MIRAVIDTNIIAFGLLSPSGNESLVLLAAHHGLMRPCLSEAILAEYVGVLARPKFAFPQEEIAALIEMLRRNGELFGPYTSAIASPDPDDSKFLHCAIAAGAEFLITGNKRHFPDATYGKTQIVSAGELLDRITQEV